MPTFRDYTLSFDIFFYESFPYLPMPFSSIGCFQYFNRYSSENKITTFALFSLSKNLIITQRKLDVYQFSLVYSRVFITLLKNESIKNELKCHRHNGNFWEKQDMVPYDGVQRLIRLAGQGRGGGLTLNI